MGLTQARDEHLGENLALRDGAVFIADAHYIPHTDGAVLEMMIYEQGVEAALESLRSMTMGEHGLGDSLVLDSSVLDSRQESSKEARLESSALESTQARYLRYVGEHGLLGLLAHLVIDFSAKPPSELPKQVFLMGDVAHLFLPHISTQGHEAFIALINALAKCAEVFYLEGNHDFGLDSRIMPGVKIYPRCLQPLLCARSLPGREGEGVGERECGGEGQRKWIMLAHGDLFISRIYEAYIRSISAPLTLSVLKLLNNLSFGVLYRLAQRRVNAKRIRALELDSKEFAKFMQGRMEQYATCVKSGKLDSMVVDSGVILGAQWVREVQGVIEGHFHIGRVGKYTPQGMEQGACGEYFALPSFYCDKRILVL